MIGGRKALLYILVEHHNIAHPLMPMRLLKYMVRVWDQFILTYANTAVVSVIAPNLSQ